MKPRLTKLLKGFGAIACTVWLAGCEVEAEESEPTASNDAARVATASAAGTNSLSSAASTNNPVAITNITNEQAVVIAEIPPAIPANLSLTKGVEEVVKLAQAGVSETVLLLYVEKYPDAFDLDASEIVYLHDIGVSGTVIAALLSHDGAGEDLQNVLANTVEEGDAADLTAASGPSAEVADPGNQAVEVTSNYVANASTPMTAPAASTVPGADVGAYQPQPAEGQQTVVIQAPAQIIQTAPATTYSYFYSSLSPYGSWIEVPEYGWCWQPTIARTYYGWRPYAHGGRWLYSNHGWYWHSDYSWGWAPFHYGRWYSAPSRGWVWVPDYTWGPSWVTWRRGPDYCGWAPLPPRSYYRPGIGFTYYDRNVSFSFGFGLGYEHYTFVPSHRFHHRRIVDHVIPTQRARTIYNNTTVINNYVVGNNNTIINNGIGRDYVAAKTRSEIRQVNIVEAPSTPGRVVRPDRVLAAGDQSIVYRPSRPPAQLVRAHENLTRARQESRSTASPLAPTRGALVRPDNDRSPALAGTASSSPGARPSRTPLGARSESASPRIGDANFPVLAKPAPVRVRPEPSPLAVSSRQSAIRPSTTRPQVGGVVSSRTERSASSRTIQSGLPASTDRSTSPLTTRPSRSGATVRPDYLRSTAPTVTSRSIVPNRSIGTARSESPRLSSPAVPGTSTFRNETASQAVRSRPTIPTQTPRVISPAPQRQAVTPAPSTARPAAPVTRSTPRPTVSTPAYSPRTTTPSRSFPQAPATRPSTSLRPVTPAAGPTTTYRPVAPATRSVAPATPATRQPAITPSRPATLSPSRPVTVAPSRPAITPRSEPIGGRTVAPRASAPAVRSAPPPSFSRPAPSVPRSAPTVIGSQPRSSAPSAPAIRPSTPAARPITPATRPSSSASRGRVEIGR